MPRSKSAQVSLEQVARYLYNSNVQILLLYTFHQAQCSECRSRRGPKKAPVHNIRDYGSLNHQILWDMGIGLTLKEHQKVEALSER